MIVPVHTDGIFTCTAIADASIEWRITARGLTSLSFISQSVITLNYYGITKIYDGTVNNTVVSKVKVVGSIANNGTRLHCKVFFRVSSTLTLENSDDAEYLLYGKSGMISQLNFKGLFVLTIFQVHLIHQ